MAVKLNKVTIWDANLLPSTDKSSEEFAQSAITSLIDFFFRYNRVDLGKKSRDLIRFINLLGLMKMTIQPQIAINSVAQFVRIVTKTLVDHFWDQVQQFLDNLGVKEIKIPYNNEVKTQGIWR